MRIKYILGAIAFVVSIPTGLISSHYIMEWFYKTTKYTYGSTQHDAVFMGMLIMAIGFLAVPLYKQTRGKFWSLAPALGPTLFLGHYISEYCYNKLSILPWKECQEGLLFGGIVLCALAILAWKLSKSDGSSIPTVPQM